MTLPYSNATTGQRALDEIQKILRRFGCSSFAHGADWETGDIFIQFKHMGRPVNMKASARGYAAAWLRENPYTHRRQSTKQEWESKALAIGQVAVYSILRDWVKGQTAAIDTGILTFEAAFLSHIMLPSGQTVIEHIQHENLLPAPQDCES